MIRRAAASALLVVALATFTPIAAADVIDDMNDAEIATVAASGWQVPRQQRAHAIIQRAVYEAVNAITGQYPPSSHAVAADSSASNDAAVIAAACATMDGLLFPAPALERADCRNRLARLPRDEATRKGLRLGRAAATAILRWRSDDGANWSTDYTPPAWGPAAYQRTGEAEMITPQIGHMRPFVLTSYADIRPPPPPALDSTQLRRDIAEVAALGGASSTARTADQTEVARFHFASAASNWMRLARQAADASKADSATKARAIALAAMAIMDVQGALWDAKYFYNYLRPVTAIHAGAGGAIAPDAAWRPLLPTPPHPEYPCGHCGAAAAAQTVLESMFGDGPQDFVLSVDGATRRYHSFRHYAEEENISRLYAGAHFRWSMRVGDTMGRDVGAQVVRAVAQPGGW